MKKTTPMIKAKDLPQKGTRCPARSQSSCPQLAQDDWGLTFVWRGTCGTWDVEDVWDVWDVGDVEDRKTGRERHVVRLMLSYINRLKYLPHKAAAEISSHNEPIGRMCGIQLVRKSVDFRFDCCEIEVIWLSITDWLTNWLTDWLPNRLPG